MAAGPRWAAGIILVLLAACGGEGDPALDSRPQAESRVQTAAVEPVQDRQVTPESAPPAPEMSDPALAEDLESTEPVMERASRWLATDSPTQVARALRLLIHARDRGEMTAELEALAERAVRWLIAWGHLGFAHGDRQPAEEVLPVLERWAADDAQVVAMAQQVARLRQVDALIARAAELRASGQRLPPGENALDVLREAQRIAPERSDVVVALKSIQAELLAEALDDAKRERFAEANARLADAARVLPGSDVVQDAAARIVEARERATARWKLLIAGALSAGDADAAHTLLAGLERVSAEPADLDWARAGIERVRLYGIHAPGNLVVDPLISGGSGPGMVVLAAGSYQMGSPRSDRNRPAAEAPQHRVTFSRGFALARTETTVGQYRAFVEASGYRTRAEKRKRSTVYDERSGAMVEKRGVTWQDDYAGQPAADDLPVVHLAWADAAAYAQWLSEQTGHTYRLPSEAEFEYALRAGGDTRFPWGDGAPPERVENLTGSRDSSTSGRSWSNAFDGYGDGAWGPAAVGNYTMNRAGLADINGNVSEWTADCWHDSYARAPRDGSAWVNPGCKDRVIRGASWASSPEQARSAFRQRAQATTTSARVGFRVARDLHDPVAAATP